MACPGSVALIDKMIEQGLKVDSDNQAARDGTQAHYYAECRIKSLYGPIAEQPIWTEKATEARSKLSDEYVKNAETYVSWVSSFLFGQTGD